MYRFELGDAQVRIGRDQSNDIWIDSPAVRPQTCLVYARDGEHHLKVYDGARVLLNGQAVRGLNRLYSGDRIGVGDRELLYGRDDCPAELAIGVTVLVDGAAHHAQAFRRTRTKVGRRDCDLVLDDESVADAQLLIECYGEHGSYVVDLAARENTFRNGKPVVDRCALHDGDILQFGNIALRVRVLPAEAHGLLMNVALPERQATKAADRAAGQPGVAHAAPRSPKADGRASQGGFLRPESNPNTAQPAAVPLERRPPAPEPLPEPPPADHAGSAATQIGSLQQMLRDAQLGNVAALGEPQHTVMADAVRSQLGDYLPRPAPAEKRAPEQLRPDELQPLDQPPPLPSARDQLAAGNAPVERPAVRIQIDRPQPAVPPARGPERRPAWQDESSQRENLRVRPRETEPDPRMVAMSGSPHRPGTGGFHELRTEMLDTQAVRDGSRGDWQQDPILRRVFANSVMRPEGAPSTEVMEAYQPAAHVQDGWPPGQAGRRESEPVRDDDPRHRQALRDRAATEDLSVPGQQDRYRLGRSTGGWEGESRDRSPPRDDGREELKPPRDEFRRSQSVDRDPPRDEFRRSQSADRQDPERYRISRGESPQRHVQDDRPRVRVRELSEAERRANPDYDQPTDRAKGPQGETDASRREREQRVIDSSRRGFDRDRDR
ncbi:MAG: FHA domain-containing protein [Deltaproteobacteria bacterium]|nr:FHA domain-containing protein [Deltaproteobacteria bacterium]